MSDAWESHPTEELRVKPGFSITDVEHAATPGWTAGKDAAKDSMAKRGEQLADLQEMLHADGISGGQRSVLLVLQGMDTSGKGGIVRRVIGMVDPQGVSHRSFGVPTAEERAHHYLWRIENALPKPGKLGVFDRSHYEDVLIVRVHDLVPAKEWEQRYDEINAFEERVAASGTVIVKCALMVSPAEQLRRLEERLHRPDKYWKYNPGDLDEREHWDEYMQAYQAVFDRCSTEVAPWYAVPTDRKWYARHAITEILTTAFEGLGLTWPAANFDVDAERRRIEGLRGGA